MFFVNPPICLLVLAATFSLISGERRAPDWPTSTSLGAVLATGAMLLLVYALVRAPDVGWGSARTIGELAGAAALLVAS